MRAAFVLVLFLAALPAAAQVTCGPNQQVCGSLCYFPADGQRCLQGGIASVPVEPPAVIPAPVVCGPGELACGFQCYKPAAGQQCFYGGLVCGAGQVACGEQCIDPAAGQTCAE